MEYFTPEDKATFDAAFSSSNRAGERQATKYIYVTAPARLDSADKIANADERARRDIVHLELIISALKTYRQALTIRYNELSTAATTPVVRLKREKAYFSDRIIYSLYFLTRFLENNEERIDNTITFSGKERSKAITAYKDYVASHPGIIAEMDIEKKAWEK